MVARKTSGRTVALHIMHGYGFGGMTPLIINLSPRKEWAASHPSGFTF